jgi:hypothetical protein
MRFADLKVGDVMTLAGQTAVVLAIEKPHPENPRFWMFIWYLFGDKRLSFDMLDPQYELIPGSRVSDDGLLSFQAAIRELTR